VETGSSENFAQAISAHLANTAYIEFSSKILKSDDLLILLQDKSYLLLAQFASTNYAACLWGCGVEVQTSTYAYQKPYLLQQ
jgi:hypothetical protein